MKFSLKLPNYKGFCALSFEGRIALTVVGLFVIVFFVSMTGQRFTNSKLTSIFSEIESRNILAAKKNIEHDLLSWNSSLELIANSAQLSEWYEYKKYGLDREERRYYSTLKKYFKEAEQNQSSLFNIKLNSR